MENTVTLDPKDQVDIQFKWKGKYWFGTFNCMTYNSFRMRIGSGEIKFSMSHKTIHGCKQIKKQLEDRIERLFQSQKGDSFPFEVILSISEVMTMITEMHQDRRIKDEWKLLTSMIENPEFECKKYRVSDDYLLIFGNYIFGNMGEISQTEFYKKDPIVDMNVLIRWNGHSVVVPFFQINKGKLIDCIQDSAEAFETNLKKYINVSSSKISQQEIEKDLINYCQEQSLKIYQNIIQPNLETRVVEDMKKKETAYKLFGFLYFIEYYLEKNEWKFLQQFGEYNLFSWQSRQLCKYCNYVTTFDRIKCANCKNVGVYYCSTQCQIKDWYTHSASCEKIDMIHCSFCNQMMKLNKKICSGCKLNKVYYCSSECQKCDWKNHKLICQSQQKQNEFKVNEDVD